jgi:hypothetical protein
MRLRIGLPAAARRRWTQLTTCEESAAPHEQDGDGQGQENAWHGQQGLPDLAGARTRATGWDS